LFFRKRAAPVIFKRRKQHEKNPVLQIAQSNGCAYAIVPGRGGRWNDPYSGRKQCVKYGSILFFPTSFPYANPQFHIR